MEQPQGPSKRIRKLLREAAGEAYQRELNAALAELDASFDKWRKGEMSPFELSDKIHEFHQGPSRTLWSRYDSSEAGWAVPLAVARGILKLDELPAELAQWVRPHAEALKRDFVRK